MRYLYLCIGLFIFYNVIFSQGLALSIEQAKIKNLSIEQLDLEYKSALHTDSIVAVFKGGDEQVQFQKAYEQLLKDLNLFLASKNFIWSRKTKCFQRIYFSPEGRIDYFIYNFNLKSVATEEQLSPELAAKFNFLLSQFIQNYVFNISAKVKFAQCSPTAYMPQK